MKDKIMNNKSYIIIVIIILLVMGVYFSKQVVSRYDVKNNTQNNTQNNVQNNEQVAIYHTYKVYNFGQELCPACQKMDPIYEKIKAENTNKLTFEYVDVNDNIELSNKYRIEYTPTFVVVDESGKVVDRLVGLVSETEFRDFIDKWSSK